ncbi:LpqB family beta-propeller domain-containing protein [Gandjariella thermophila]|uniref:Lipoprotein n=1 Tax=Gandjariella thermophila TaxID=1931992 RepID=A0A4D4J8E6_9PSEU|nr:LpqB family beta-propeller domain-containing protein [Gandjariella thermophila]GDY31290.1 lipoprotein [Gandjariella thermophila]
MRRSPRAVRILRAALAVLCAALPAIGCAAIPEYSPPQAVKGADESRRASPVAEPERDADPLTLVRNFILASSSPDGDHAAARLYLTKQAQDQWNTKASPSVIADSFDTLYSPSVTPSGSASRTTVVLRATKVGRLGPDSAFTPEVGTEEVPMQVERQPDGQWRISEPPDGVRVTLSGFTENYHQARLYFFDPDRQVLVPDPRYVVAQPPSGMPARVMDLLLAGPSQALGGAVRSAIPPTVSTRTNPVETPDGALEVNLDQLGDQTVQNKRLIVAQIVRSLQGVTNSRVRIESGGMPLFPDHPDWLPGDIPSYDAQTMPGADLQGLVVAGGRVRSLKDGSPVPGPAGSGEYQVVSGAQSADGSELAVVVRRPAGGMALRVGRYGETPREVDLPASQLTRPTWAPGGSTTDASNELWTVADGNVVRVVKTAEGVWVPQAVNAAELTQLGPITDLRLSRDGVRVAAVAGGRLVVSSVVRNQDSSVTLQAPRALQWGSLAGVVDVDWQSQDSLVVATSSPTTPVARLPVDGLQVDRYSSANLTAPVTAVAAAPGRPVMVVDASGAWTANDIGEVWRSMPINFGAGSLPFYPG